MANWIAGLWFARLFGLMFAHIPFSNSSWESFLGFGEGEMTVKSLIEEQGYKKVLLPLFDEGNHVEVERIKAIISSYNCSRIVFILEQDQFYRDQFGVIKDIQSKFHHALSRSQDRLVFQPDSFNIAVHVRRGDISHAKNSDNPNLILRWQDVEYFEKVLENVLRNLRTSKRVNVYLFSQGLPEEFNGFRRFKHVHYCLEMNARDSFLHMIYADLLITSKSSFSYKPALLSRGIKVCPRNFWHGYPDSSDWILVDDNGEFDNFTMRKFQSLMLPLSVLAGKER